MKKTFYVLFIISFACFSSSIFGMQCNSFALDSLANAPQEIIAHIAGYCQPHEKNTLMKVCKNFMHTLKNRELIVQTNPSTVSLSDKIKSMFAYAYSGDVNKLGIWIDYVEAAGEDVNYKNTWGITLLHVASNEKVIQLLIKHGANANIDESEQIPILNKATYIGDIASVKTLLYQDNIDPNLTMSKAMVTPLVIAAFENHTEIVKLLLCAGADINQKYGNKDTPLLIASHIGNSDVIKLLLCAGADVNQINKSKFSPLYIASERGHHYIVKVLIDAGADVNQADKYKISPLNIASQMGHADTVKLLIDAEANVNQARIDGVTPLFMASQNKNTHVVKLLLCEQADIDQPNNDGYTPLQVASANGNVKIVKLLLCAGANVINITALYLASQNGHTQVVTLLLNAKEINTKVMIEQRFNKYTPLRIAIENNHPEVASLLINAGANIDKAPFIEASYNGHTKIVTLLLAAGADVNQTNSNGWTALSAASYKGYTEIVQLLLNAGADTQYAIKYTSDPVLSIGDNALQIAQKKGHADIVELLIGL